MAIIAYRPELQSPAREGNLAVAFATPGLDRSGNRSHAPMSTLTLEPGVNRNVSDEHWALIRETPGIKALIKIKAIKEIKATASAEEDLVAKSPEVEEVRGLPVEDALSVIEASYDPAFLEALKGADPRRTVQGKIIARLAALAADKG